MTAFDMVCLLLQEKPRTTKELLTAVGCSERLIRTILGRLRHENRLAEQKIPGGNTCLWSWKP